MFSHHFDQTPGIRITLNWFMLSFNGGFINAGGFLATGKFVSHVTGFATLFGVDISNHQVGAAIGILSVPIFFLIGAFLAGLLIDYPIYKGKRPHFDWVMGFSSCILLFAATAGELLFFGDFSEKTGLGQNYLLLACLCLACGLQNGAITSSSGKSVRTTHLTGLVTDLGLGLARLFTLDFKNIYFQKEVKANYLRLGSIIAFISGSAVGAWCFLHVGYKGFILAALIAAYAAWHGRKVKLSPHNSLVGELK